MKLRWKFALLSVGVCAVPMAIAGLSAARIGQIAIRQSIEAQEGTVARQAAEHVADELENALATLRVEARILDLTAAGKTLPGRDTLTKFLQFIYLQRHEFSVVGLYDVRGTPLGEPAFQEHPRENSSLGQHDPITPAEAEDLPRRAPLQEIMRHGVAVGPVFLSGPQRVPQLILGIKYHSVVDGPPSILVAQVSLRRIAAYLSAFGAADRGQPASVPDRRVYLLDRQTRIVAASDPQTPLLRTKTLPDVPSGMLPSGEFVAAYPAEQTTVIGAFAPAGPFRMGVLTERPLESALRPISRMNWATLYWMTVSGIVAAVVAVVIGRRLSNRIEVLSQGARHVAQGRLDLELPVLSRDELGDLARAFNAMTSSLSAARAEILRQTAEIKSWNESLEQRVKEKTTELQRAQDIVLRSRAMAAIGSLGAGVAHEINNPLAGVLGLAQLLLEDLPSGHPARPMVMDIEDQALRIKGIVANLLRLTQRGPGEDFTRLDLGQLVDDALDLCNPAGMAERGIYIEKRIPRPSPAIRGSAVALETALIQIIKNATNAMAGGGRLTFETSLLGDKLVQLAIHDTGKGIHPEHLDRIFEPFFTTKSHWEETGMGLSVVHKIVEDHGGTIRVESTLGEGTTFFLTFPLDPGAPHLV